MSNPYGVAEISVADVAARWATDKANMIVLDVREPHELNMASLGAGIEVAPLSELGTVGADALPERVKADKSAEIIVMCHHGARSAQVVAWLQQQEYTNVLNLAGGIHAWAQQIDPTVGMY